MKAFCSKCKKVIDDKASLECAGCGSRRPPYRDWPVDPYLHRTIHSYRVDGILGAGGFGNVYMARHTLMSDRLMAMKILRPELAKDPALQEDFLRETRLLIEFDHPNIVKCHELGRLEDNSLFVLMEYVPGKDLKKILLSKGPLSIERVLNIGLQIVSALAVAHGKEVLHRDLKPDNVLLPARTTSS